MLLDEADVFLEKRVLQDLHRNSLVSGQSELSSQLLLTASFIFQVAVSVFSCCLPYLEGSAITTNFEGKLTHDLLPKSFSGPLSIIVGSSS